jgi:Zn-dependent protease
MDVDVLSAVIGFVVFIFSVVVHENAHGIAADYFGDPTARYMGRITMNPVPHIDPIGSVVLPLAAFFSGVPFIGWAKPVPVNSANLRNPLVHNAYVAAAGPASNFILAFFGAVLWIVVGLVFKHVPGLMDGGERTLLFFNTLCRSLILFNCILGVFNLMPIPPLDGHWILIRFLPSGPREAVASIGRFGFLILLLLLWTGALWWVIGPPFRLLLGVYQAFVSTAVRML